MSVTLLWLGHAAFKITQADNIIYIDPWKIKQSTHDATLVLVSHSHYDHYSSQDIAKVSGLKAQLIAPADVISRHKTGQSLSPGQTIESGGINITGVAAYNPVKQFHPKNNNWIGFVIQVGSKRIYYAGDTDLTTEMKNLSDIDIALLPVGGTYTMNPSDAIEAISFIKPQIAVPYHWGDIVGARSDAEKFARDADCDVRILTPGRAFTIE